MPPKNNTFKLWFLFPFYEKSSIPLNKIITHLLLGNYNIIVIDDFSEPPFNFSYSTSQIILIRHKKRMGKGAAISSGLKYITDIAADKANCFVLTADSDGQHDIEDIDKAIKIWENAPDKNQTLFIGERDFRNSQAPLWSKIGRIVSSFLIYLQTGKKIYDTQSGLRIYPLNFLEEIKFSSNGFEFETETLIIALKKGLSVKTFPIKTIYPEYKKTNFRRFNDSFKILLLHLKFFLKASCLKKK